MGRMLTSDRITSERNKTKTRAKKALITMHMDEYAPDKPGAFLIYPRNIPEGYDRRRPLNRDSSGWQQNRQYPIEIYVNVPVYRVTDTPEEQTANQTSVVDSNEISESYNANNIPEQRIRQADEEGLTTNKRGRMSVRSKRILFSTIVSMVIIIIIIIVIAVPLSLRKPSTDRFSKIKAVVQSISSKNDLKNSSSPQSRALHWLVYEDGLNVSDTDFVWLRQRYTMAVLYYSTGGETWTNSLHFLESIHECLWHNISSSAFFGVYCSNFTIDTLSMNDNNMSGTLSIELSSLLALRVLSLPSNSIGGSFPSNVASLPHLETVFIPNNKLTGRLPIHLSSFPGSAFVLSQNNLVGTIPPISHLSSLTNFDVTQNHLSGTIPLLPVSLVTLDLSRNILTGSFPSFLGDLTNASMILLHRNDLIGTIPDVFGRITSLLFFSINHNSLSGTIPSTIWRLTSLIMLGLGSNLFSGGLEGIGQLKSLQGLSLDNNNLNGTLPSEIGQLKDLRSLNMEINKLHGTIPEELGHLTKMKYLSFGDNLFTGSLPQSFSALTKLDFLTAARTNINGTLKPLCDAYNSTSRYYIADCTTHLQCPIGCCRICCDNPIFQSVCDNSQIYVDPLLIAYSLYSIDNGNFTW